MVSPGSNFACRNILRAFNPKVLMDAFKETLNVHYIHAAI